LFKKGREVLKNILIAIGIIIVGILLIISIFFDFNFDSTSNESKNNNEEIREYSGTENNEVENNEETNNNENNEENNEKDEENEDEMKKESKETATNFVKEFHSLDETSDNPVKHIENAEEYIDDDFYEVLLNEFPVNPDGTDKQTWDKVSTEEIGKNKPNRLWDVHVKGELKSDDDKEKLDMNYIVQVTETSGGEKPEVTNVWIDPPIARDDDGQIDLYEGKSNMGENEDIEEVDDLDEEEKVDLLLRLLEREQEGIL